MSVYTRSRLHEVICASGTTRFLYDGDELVAEYNTSGTLLRRYAHGTNVDDPVIWYEGSGYATPRFLHTNWQGSVVAVTDSSASSIATNSYDEWGIPAATNQGRFQYTGQAWIPEIGMYYYKARIYSPTLGRFMQTDPVGYDDQINLYAYAGNDPVNMTDPDGEQYRSSRYGTPTVTVTFEARPPRIPRAPPDYKPRSVPTLSAPNRSNSTYLAGAYAANARVDRVHFSVVGYGSFSGQCLPNEGIGNSNRSVGAIQSAFAGTTYLRASSPGVYNYNGGGGGLGAAENFAQQFAGGKIGSTGSGGSVYSLSGLPTGTTGTVSTYNSDGGYARATVRLTTTVTETGSIIPKQISSEFKVRFDK